MKYISAIIAIISTASVLAAISVIFFVATAVPGNNNLSECAADKSGVCSLPASQRQDKGNNADDINGGQDRQSETEAANIIVEYPIPNQEIGLPALIKGRARVFESNLNYRIIDDSGSVLAENFAMADSSGAGQFGPFEISANYARPQTSGGTIEMFAYAAKDGSETDKVSIPVAFKDVADMTVKVYFQNSKLDPAMLDCGKIFPAERRIAKTSAPARVALEELLAGPNALESNDGYTTSINPGVSIQKLTIENGLARADLSEMLDRGVAGSCRVTAIRSQITETLQQFSSVNEVVISIGGRSEDILQP